MNDRDLHDWLLRQTPGATPARLDARVLGVAEELLSARRGRAVRRRILARSLLALAAVLVFCATLLVVLRDSSPEETITRQAVTLRVSDGAHFELAAGARYVHQAPFHRLRLIDGEATVSAIERSLEVAFPGGVFHVERGEGKVTIQRDGERSMQSNQSIRTAREPNVSANAKSRSAERVAVRNGAVIAIVLVSGVAWLEWPRGTPELAREEMSPGETILVEAESRPEGFVATSFRREKASGPGPGPTLEPRTRDATAAPATLIPLGSSWRYTSGAAAPGGAWRERSFDDSTWPLGHAELGFGDGDEVTVVDGGPEDARYPTVYFRKRFEVADPAAYEEGLILRVRRDDGAVAYLNGKEVFRSNLPAVEITHATLAEITQNGDDEKALAGALVDPSALVAGENVIAVEVHQSSLSSSDASFDLELRRGSIDELTPFRGRVVDGETGEPIARAQVGLRPGWPLVMRPGRNSQMFRIVDRETGDVHFAGSPYDNVVRETALWFPFDAYEPFRGELTTGADGEFGLREPRPGDTLRVEVEGYIPLLIGPLAADERVASGASYELARPYVVSGRIVTGDGRSLGPISHLTLEIRIDLAGTSKHVLWNVEVDQNFHFEQVVDQVDEVTLSCAAEGYAPIETKVPLEHGIAAVELVLPPHPSLAGRVVDASGEPLAGAEIRVGSRESGFFKSWNWRAGVTDAEGAFIANVFGPVVKVEVFKKGYAPRTIEDVDAEAGPLEVLLLPTENGIITGQVTDADGRPLAGVDIRATRAGTGELVRGVARVAATTDESGSFALELQPAEWTLRFHLFGLPRAEGQPEMAIIGEDASVVAVPFVQTGVNVLPGASNPRLDIVLPRGGTIAGSVTGEGGEPVAGRTVSLYAVNLLTAKSTLVAGAVSDAEGSFELHHVKPGMYAVHDSDDRSNHMVTVRAGVTSQVALGGLTSTLDVSVERAGEPLREAPVVIGRIDGTLTDAQLGRTSAEGKFRFEKLRPGLHLILVTDPERRVSMLAAVELHERERRLELVWPATKLVIEVAEPLSQEARVLVEWLEFEGVPLEGLGPSAYRLAGEATSADRTSFTLEGLVPGVYRVRTEGVEPARAVDVVVGEEDAVARLE